MCDCEFVILRTTPRLSHWCTRPTSKKKKAWCVFKLLNIFHIAIPQAFAPSFQKRKKNQPTNRKPYKSCKQWITESLKLKDHLTPHPLPWTWTSSTRRGCSTLHPTWPWMLPRMWQPQLLRATCSICFITLFHLGSVVCSYTKVLRFTQQELDEIWPSWGYYVSSEKIFHAYSPVIKTFQKFSIF